MSQTPHLHPAHNHPDSFEGILDTHWDSILSEAKSAVQPGYELTEGMTHHDILELHRLTTRYVAREFADIPCNNHYPKIRRGFYFGLNVSRIILEHSVKPRLARNLPVLEDIQAELAPDEIRDMVQWGEQRARVRQILAVGATAIVGEVTSADVQKEHVAAAAARVLFFTEQQARERLEQVQ